MIAVSSSGKSFRGLAAYLAKGRDRDSPERLVWSASRNLPTKEPELAATFMRATASRSDRVEKPVYHVVLSFDPSDRVERATMERVADRVLERLGLSDYQTVIVSHGDRQHPHVHLFINRVHPETGRAWERWKDQPLIQQVLREEEVALGLRPVASSLSPSQEQRASISPEQLIESRGKSKPTVDGKASRANSERKIGELDRDLEAYERVDALTRELRMANVDAEVARARVTRLDIAHDRARAAEVAFMQSLRNVYRDPAEARRSFASLVHAHGATSAARTLAQHPEQIGPLLLAEKRHALGLVRTRDDASARAASVVAAPLGERAIAENHLLWSTILETRMRRLDADFARLLGTLYDRPEQAKKQFDRHVERGGVEYASTVLASSPEKLGTMTSRVGPHGENLTRTRSEAAEAGRQAWQARGELSRQALTSPGDAMTLSLEKAEREAGRMEVKVTSDRESQRKSELKRLPRESVLRQRIASTVSYLLPYEMRMMTTAISAPRVALAMKLRATIREVLLGREGQESG